MLNVIIGKRFYCFLIMSVFSLMVVLGSIGCYAQWNKSYYTVGNVVFNTNVVPNTTNDEPLDILSKLYLPRNADGPFSLVIISPSSGGVEKEREIFYAKRLVKAGIAALVIDSFKSRDLKNSIYDQSVLEAWQMANDAFGGLKFMSKDPRINAEKIGIMGVSKGGSVAMDTAHDIVRSWAGLNDEKFAAHIAISPDCNWTTRSNYTTGAPLLFMLAELDDQTSVEACVLKAKRLEKAGNDKIKTIIYEGAHHAWEELGRKPVYDPKAENFADCRVWVENNGNMRSAETNATVEEDGWYEWASKNCMKLGAHCCGGTRELKEKATQDIIRFFKKNGF